ncbi:hypothetical protein EII22_08945 [Coriobacteriales bacterium OH1046]|nr:hypothetical protein EII22_08945 [Coriobacteriales bacterium OH1046]
MIARYERDKVLNVREEPYEGAAVVRQMAPGEESACSEVRAGWARLGDGYAKAAFLTIADGEPVKRGEPGGGAAQVAGPASEDAPDDGELGKMTVGQLREIAAASGIRIRKDAAKREIIAAILGDA